MISSTMIIVFVCVTVYALIGFLMIENGMFDHTQTNPIQDAIHWMRVLVQGSLWPALVIMWFTSAALNDMFWEGYVSHEDRMERIVAEMIREIESEMLVGDVSYHTPSPRQYREMGNSAFYLTVTEINGEY